MTLDQVREGFAEELRVACNVRSPHLVDALARVPRHRFLGPGPWLVRGEGDLGGPRQTGTDDPREVYHNASIAIDASRHLYNGQPGTIVPWLEALAISPAERVLHIGCATGYYTALIAHMVGPSGRVFAVDIDPDLAERARANLTEWPWAQVAHGDGCSSLPIDVDVILVHAGATHVLDQWLNAIAEGGRLLVPLTCSMPAMPGSLGKGGVLVAKRSRGKGEGGHDWTAQIASMVMIYSLVGARDDTMNTRLGQAFMAGKWNTVTRLRRDVHEKAPSCWLHAETICLAGSA
jgi:protein-L-isoaspartate(D-aspartate) O-methyltransferase